MNEAVEKFRKDCVINDAKRDAGLKTPEDVERFDDIQYGPDEKWNVLDVYLPRERAKGEERPEGRGEAGGRYCYSAEGFELWRRKLCIAQCAKIL